jgi:hypothetical protein
MGNSKRHRLDIATKRNIKDLIPKIFKLKGKKKVFDKKKVDDIIVRVDDGTMYEVSIYLDTSINYFAHVQDISDEEGFFDYELLINPLLIKSEKDLYNKLYHELLHVTDPDITTAQTDEYINLYDASNVETYYGTKIEFRAWIGEILEALHNEVINELNYINTKDDIQNLKNTLKNIVVHLAEGYEILPSSNRLIRKMSGREENIDDFTNLLKKLKLKSEFEHLIEPFEEEIMPEYLLVLNLFKEHNKPLWVNFIQQLKHLYNELIDVIDNFQFD